MRKRKQHSAGDQGYVPNAFRDNGVCWCQSCWSGRGCSDKHCFVGTTADWHEDAIVAAFNLALEDSTEAIRLNLAKQGISLDLEGDVNLTVDRVEFSLPCNCEGCLADIESAERSCEEGSN